MNSVGNGENIPALEFAGLFKRFGDNMAVDHIDLAVPAGSFFGLVGPNGAGKTTSLSMAVGLAQQRLENYGPEIFARVRAPIG
jgi:ABC-2 type transport system ATP-binding protein